MEKKGKKWAVKILILHLFKSFPSSVLSIQCLFVCIRMFKFIYIHVFVSYTLSMPSALEEHMENLLVWLHFLLYIYIYTHNVIYFWGCFTIVNLSIYLCGKFGKYAFFFWEESSRSFCVMCGFIRNRDSGNTILRYFTA